MEALFYETLIRNVFNSGRTEKHGANADIYRAMEHSYRDYKITKSQGSEYDREYDFRSNFAIVRIRVREAIEAGIKEISYKATSDDTTLLKQMKDNLGLDFYDKE